MANKSPQQYQKDIEEYDVLTRKNVDRLNQLSNDIRLGKIENFDHIARYSAGTATVMFGFLGVLAGMNGALSSVSKILFGSSMVVFVMCIAISLSLRQSIKLYAFYLQNNFYLKDRKTLFSLQRDVMAKFPDKIAVITRSDGNDIENKILQERLQQTKSSIDKLENELVKSKQKTKLYELIFKYGGWSLYMLFSWAYMLLATFILLVLKEF